MLYYFEENIDLDYATIQRFGNLDVSPPTDQTDCEKVNKTLVELRDALNLAGKLEQTEGKARFTKDGTVLEDEEYKKLKAEYEALDYQIKKKVDNIKHMSKFGKKLNINSFEGSDDDDDEDFTAGEGAEKYTNLRPQNRQRNDRGGYAAGDRRRN